MPPRPINEGFRGLGEEPDDVLGHRAIRDAIRPVRVATGEHVQNKIIFKQMLQAEAIDIVQIDACRVGGINENLAILLLAAKFGVPVCPLLLSRSVTFSCGAYNGRRRVGRTAGVCACIPTPRLPSRF